LVHSESPSSLQPLSVFLLLFRSWLALISSQNVIKVSVCEETSVQSVRCLRKRKP
jgi:hypothetical protein